MIKNPNSVQLAAQRNLAKACIEIYVSKGEPPSMCVAVPLEFKAHDHTGEYEKPTMQLRYDEVQQLMDELWACGIRPTEVGGPGELAATKAHLKDMRDIAFSYLSLQK